MTTPIQSNSFPKSYCSKPISENARVTFLALSILTSFVAMVTLPWQISIPVSTVLLGSSLFCFALSSSDSLHGIARPVNTPPLIIEHRNPYIAPSLPVFSVPLNPIRTLVGARDFFRRHRPTTSNRAPVGTGEFTHVACAPVRSPIGTWESARYHRPTTSNRAPVGTGEFTHAANAPDRSPMGTWESARYHRPTTSNRAPVGTGEFTHTQIPSYDNIPPTIARRAPVGRR